MGKLFLYGDFKALPVVKEIMAENDFSLPVTDERWHRVSNALPDIVAAHGKTIELDCVKKLCAVQDAEMVGCHFDDDNLGRGGKDNDCIPTCLLTATSLFRLDQFGPELLESYSDILRKRANMPLQSHADGCYAWNKEKIQCSGVIVSTAAVLLEHLKLPKETTLAYMLACGSGFQCLRCTRTSDKRSRTWPQLVSWLSAASILSETNMACRSGILSRKQKYSKASNKETSECPVCCIMRRVVI